MPPWMRSNPRPDVSAKRSALGVFSYILVERAVLVKPPSGMIRCAVAIIVNPE